MPVPAATVAMPLPTGPADQAARASIADAGVVSATTGVISGSAAAAASMLLAVSCGTANASDASTTAANSAAAAASAAASASPAGAAPAPNVATVEMPVSRAAAAPIRSILLRWALIRCA